VNYGSVEGTIACGIGNRVVNTSNVVNVGNVVGTNETYSFWQVSDGVPKSVYGIKDKCENCDGNITLISMNTSDNRYHTVDGEHEIVDVLLNEEVKNNGEYELGWDRKLYLRTPTIIHIGNPINRDIEVYIGSTLEDSCVPDDIFNHHLVPKGMTPCEENEVNRSTIIEDGIELIPYYVINISGEVNEVYYIEVDNEQKLGEVVDKLKEYLESKDYAVGDIDNNALLNGGSPILRDMNVVVMKKHVVIIDIEESKIHEDDVNTSAVAEAISVLTGIDRNDILVDIDVDEQGYVMRVIVMLQNVNLCDTLISAINNIVKDENCQYGVLCHNLGARLEVEGEILLSFSYRTEHNERILLTFLVIINMLMFIN